MRNYSFSQHEGKIDISQNYMSIIRGIPAEIIQEICEYVDDNKGILCFLNLYPYKNVIQGVRLNLARYLKEQGRISDRVAVILSHINDRINEKWMLKWLIDGNKTDVEISILLTEVYGVVLNQDALCENTGSYTPGLEARNRLHPKEIICILEPHVNWIYRICDRLYDFIEGDDPIKLKTEPEISKSLTENLRVHTYRNILRDLFFMDDRTQFNHIRPAPAHEHRQRHILRKHKYDKYKRKLMRIYNSISNFGMYRRASWEVDNFHCQIREKMDAVIMNVTGYSLGS